MCANGPVNSFAGNKKKLKLVSILIIQFIELFQQQNNNFKDNNNIKNSIDMA